MAGSIIDLAKYRFEKAKGSLRIAESLSLDNSKSRTTFSVLLTSCMLLLLRELGYLPQIVYSTVLPVY